MTRFSTHMHWTCREWTLFRGVTVVAEMSLDECMALEANPVRDRRRCTTKRSSRLNKGAENNRGDLPQWPL
jgi:hypothetical protein